MSNIIPFAKPSRVQVELVKEVFTAKPVDDTLDRLVATANQTCLVALDKTLAAIRRSPSSYDAASKRLSYMGERIIRACNEIALTLPKHQRSSYHAD